MSEGKVEVKTVQDVADHFLVQLQGVQEEARDGDLQLLWSMNLFLIKLVEELGSQLGFSFDFGTAMETASTYVSANFDKLKSEERQYHDFRALMTAAYPGMEGDEAPK